MARRIVLLYAHSGAGKTSLIQADLIQRLEDKGLHVLPTLRVGRELPEEADLSKVSKEFNPYLFRVLATLEDDLPRSERLSASDLANMSLDDYLTKRHLAKNRFVVLIFDQFEEILTLNPADREAKERFFRELGQALRNNRRVWALFAIRERFLASLDPFLRYIPTQLASRYRLTYLGPEAALQAIKEPAGQAGVPFADDTAEPLRDELLNIRFYRPDGTLEEQAGHYVEPGILQVVCRRLWFRLSPDASEIARADLEALGSLDNAMADYYAEHLEAARRATGVSKRKIRAWIEKNLITKRGLRNRVLREEPETRGLATSVLDELEQNAHLIRTERQRGLDWIELAHDRWVRPIQDKNKMWRKRDFRIGVGLGAAAAIMVVLLVGYLASELRKYRPVALDFQATQVREAQTAEAISSTAGATSAAIQATVDAKQTAIHASYATLTHVPLEQEEATSVPIQTQVAAEQTALRQQLATATAAGKTAVAPQSTAEALGTAVAQVASTLQPRRHTPIPPPTVTPTLPPAGLRLSRVTDHPDQESVPSFSPDGSQIVYESNRDGPWRIYLMNTDGDGRAEPIDKDPGKPDVVYQHPRFLPQCDGVDSGQPRSERIAFVSNSDGDRDVYVVDLAESNTPENLTDDLDGIGEDDQYYPRFSSDGCWMAFMNRPPGGPWEIYVMELSSSSSRRAINISQKIESGGYGDVYPVFRPDGTGLVFQSDREGEDNWDIYKLEGPNGDNLLDIDKLGSLGPDDVTRLTDHPDRDAVPDVAPDGSIVFESERTGNYDLYQMNWDGEDERPLTTDGANNQMPAFAPDFTRIIFQSDRDGNWNLFVLDLD